MIDFNEYDGSLSLVVCDGCAKKLCVVQDLGEAPWALIGLIVQNSNGLHHFCDKNCLRLWTYGAEEK